MTSIIKTLWGMGGKRKAAGLVQALPGAPEFRFIGGNLVPYKGDKLTYIEKAYTKNDLVFSIVNLILSKAVQAPAAFYTIEDEQKYFKYNALKEALASNKGVKNFSKTYAELRDLRSKAIKLYTNDGYLNELIQWPNENESFSDHNRGLWGWKLITGDYYEAGWTPWSGGLQKGKPMGWYSLPSQFVSILASGNTLPITAEKYLLQLGTEIPFDKEDILHEKYWNPEWDLQGNQLYGLSPLRAALMRVQRNNEVQYRGARTAKNGGADVVAYLDAPEDLLKTQFEVARAQKNKLKETWDLEQAGNDNAGRAVWSTYKVGATRLGLSPVEMDALNSETVDLRFLCNALGGVPSQLLNDSEASTYNNVEQAEKALTVRCAFPLLTDRERNFNRKLRQMPAYKGTRIVMEFDRTSYAELEEDKTELVTWMEKSYLPIRRRYELLNEDIPEGMAEEELNAIPVPSGTTLLSELFMQPQGIQQDVNALDQSGNNPYGNP